MSKAFTKHDASEAPLVVRPRPPLPAGEPNYVTARGLALLRAELAALEGERAGLADDAERDDRRALLDARVAELRGRMASARLVDPRAQPQDEVRFGATVTLRTLTGAQGGEERRLRIVGVDEASPADGCVAFVAPIAQAVLGLRVGETAVLAVGDHEVELEVTRIAYEET